MENLVSICIPTFNGAKYIAEAMDSAIEQTYSNIEIIISDDKSNDNTLAIVESYREKTDIPIYIYHHQPNGIGANWNNSVKKANGEYIKFLFQDDILYSSCIEKMILVFCQNPKLGLVACKRDFIIEEKKSESINNWINKYGNLQSDFEKNEPITFLDNTFFKNKNFLRPPLNKIGEPPVVMFKKSMLAKVTYFDEKLVQILDYIFYYKILKHYPIAIINKPLVAFRIHKDQATSVNKNKSIPDYKMYDVILYKDFFKLLNDSEQDRLQRKFSIYNKFKRVLKKIVNK